MKYNKGFAPLILLAIIVGALVIGGGAYYMGKSKENNIKVENFKLKENIATDNIISKAQKDWKEYKNPEAGFSFKYPKEFGEIRKSEDSNSIYFNDLADNLLNTIFGISYSTFKEIKQEQDYISLASQDINSNYTGDYNPYINSEGWNNEKKLIQNNKEGDVSCLTDKDGVYRAVYCQIKKIGINTFLIKYSRNSYKGESTIKQYITYNKDMRYEIGGGKGLTYISYFPDHESFDWEGKDKYIIGTVDNLKNHNLSKEEVLVEEMLKTLVFN